MSIKHILFVHISWVWKYIVFDVEIFFICELIMLQKFDSFHPIKISCDASLLRMSLNTVYDMSLLGRECLDNILPDLILQPSTSFALFLAFNDFLNFPFLSGIPLKFKQHLLGEIT